MFIIYRKGDIRNQIIAWGADRERSSEGTNFVTSISCSFLVTGCSELEAMLLMSGAVDPPERPPPGNRRGGDESENEDDDAASRMRSNVTRTNARTQKNIRSSREDPDSDFEFDL